MYSGIIYKFTSPVGKVYIGQTTQERRRYTQHKYEARFCPNKYHFTRALKKYGFESFKYEVLERVESDNMDELLSKLNELEMAYIKKYNSLDGRYGYNRTPGGRTTNYEESCKALEKARARQLEKRSSQNYVNPQAKPIVQYTFRGNVVAKFVSSKEAGRITGISQGNITQVCIGHKRSAGGYIWKYEGEPFSIIKNETPKYKSRPVYQYDSNGKIIAEYRSARVAANAVGVQGSVIRNCCVGIKRTARGFFWSFKDEAPNIRPAIKQDKIAQFSLDGKLIGIYESSNVAMRETGICASCIRKAARNHTQITGGFLWKRI